MWSKVIGPAVLILLLSVAGRTETQESPTSDFSVSVNLVKVPISVFDSAGNMVSTLQCDNFRIWEDQALQEIRSFGIDVNPVSVVLLLDTSGSEKSELKRIREAAESFVKELSRSDRISILTFDDQVNEALDWTHDLKKVHRVLARIRPGFRTALYDAMYLAAEEKLKNIEGRKAIILLTDCLNNQSIANFSDAAQSIVQSQASLYVISKTIIVREQAKNEKRVIWLNDVYKRLFGSDDDYIEDFFKKKEAEMTDLAEKTGGRCFFPMDYDHIPGVYAEVARELKSKYYLTYVSNQKLTPDTYHRIAIEYLAPASKIIYRKGYYYLPQPVRRRIR